MANKKRVTKYLKITPLTEKNRMRGEAIQKGVRGPSLKQDISVPISVSCKMSTKLLLIETTKFYNVKNQSELADKILKKALIQLLEKAEFNWEEFLDSNELLYEASLYLEKKD